MDIAFLMFAAASAVLAIPPCLQALGFDIRVRRGTTTTVTPDVYRMRWWITSAVALLAFLFSALGLYRIFVPSIAVEVQHGGKELDGQKIDTGGRGDVVNGLIIPPFQIQTSATATILGIRIYLAEGDGRWSGPCEPTPSDENDF